MVYAKKSHFEAHQNRKDEKMCVKNFWCRNFCLGIPSIGCTLFCLITFQMWGVRTSKCLRTFDKKNMIKSCCVSSDDQFFVSANEGTDKELYNES